jgi:ABC-type transporter Mla subunit MlaD
MSAETEAIETASTALVHAMADLERAIDAVGDDSEACERISDQLPEALERLAARVSAAQTFSN